MDTYNYFFLLPIKLGRASWSSNLLLALLSELKEKVSISNLIGFLVSQIKMLCNDKTAQDSINYFLINSKVFREFTVK